MSPEEVENAFNNDFVFRRGKNGTVLAFIEIVHAKNARAFRPATKGRLKQGRQAELVLMFVLRKTVRIPKLLDLEGPAARFGDRFLSAFDRRMS